MSTCRKCGEDISEYPWGEGNFCSMACAAAWADWAISIAPTYGILKARLEQSTYGRRLLEELQAAKKKPPH